MFQIKICGITTPEDALLAAEAGADAIGLNFYEQSPRYVTPERAKEIVDAVRARFDIGRVTIVGVFVNSDANRIWSVLGAVKLGDRHSGSGIQLHGDEPPDLVRVLYSTCEGPFRFEFAPADNMHGRVVLIRAFRCDGPNFDSIKTYLRECLDGDEGLHAVLIDAHVQGAYGGTGKHLDWTQIHNSLSKLLIKPLILAGGLTPENVAEAIATARPDAVDVASGVESSPGKKDEGKVRRFIAEARRAFAELDNARRQT